MSTDSSTSFEFGAANKPPEHPPPIRHALARNENSTEPVSTFSSEIMMLTRGGNKHDEGFWLNIHLRVRFGSCVAPKYSGARTAGLPRQAWWNLSADRLAGFVR